MTNQNDMNIKTKKVILHIDVDSFFVSCEVALRLELSNKEVAIAQHIPNAIAVSLSYEAKAKGVKVPWAISAIKKKCPNLIVIEPNLSLYQNFSKKIYNLLSKNYSPLVQIVSIDEWYIDVTKVWQKFGSIKNLVLDIQKTMSKNLSMPVSIGISYNKFLAKMATAINKPLGITFITYNNYQEMIWSMPITNYYGLGKVKSSQLIKIGIETIGDLAKSDYNDPKIRKIFLNQTQKFLDNANGVGEDNLKLENNILNSISNEKTFLNGPAKDSKEVYASLQNLSSKVSQRLLERNICGSNISISIQTKEGHKSKSLQLDKLINSQEDIYLYTSQLMKKLWNNETLVCLGIKVSKIENSFQNFMNQSLLISSEDSELNKIETIIENINAKMKNKVVMSGKEFKEHKTSNQNKFR